MKEQVFELVQRLFGSDSELRNIIVLTLKMSLFSTVTSSIFGLMMGYLIGCHEFKGKIIVRRLLNTLMGIPPVVAGLIVFLALSRSGPLGGLKLLYSLQAMVIAQVVLITPIVAGLASPVLGGKYQEMKETVKGLKLSRYKQLTLLLHESRRELTAIVISAFGRSISEVGAVQLVGGNIQYKTRVMTTAIMLETNRGNFELAVSLGIVLLVISFVINCWAAILQDK